MSKKIIELQTLQLVSRIHINMKPVFETKIVNRKLINLEAVSIDVQASQRIAPCDPEYQSHIKMETNSQVALEYDHILNDSIEEILVAISNGSQPQLAELSTISKINKKKINYIAVLNLQYVQKLLYIQQKCQNLKLSLDLEVLKYQIKYWREFLVFGLTETSQQQIKYGRGSNQAKQFSKVQNIQDQVIKQKAGAKKSETIQGRGSSRMKGKTRSKNGATNQMYDCIDS